MHPHLIIDLAPLELHFVALLAFAKFVARYPGRISADLKSACKSRVLSLQTTEIKFLIEEAESSDIVGLPLFDSITTWMPYFRTFCRRKVSLLVNESPENFTQEHKATSALCAHAMRVIAANSTYYSGPALESTISEVFPGPASGLDKITAQKLATMKSKFDFYCSSFTKNLDAAAAKSNRSSPALENTQPEPRKKSTSKPTAVINEIKDTKDTTAPRSKRAASVAARELSRAIIDEDVHKKTRVRKPSVNVTQEIGKGRIESGVFVSVENSGRLGVGLRRVPLRKNASGAASSSKMVREDNAVDVSASAKMTRKRPIRKSTQQAKTRRVGRQPANASKGNLDTRSAKSDQELDSGDEGNWSHCNSPTLSVSSIGSDLSFLEEMDALATRDAEDSMHMKSPVRDADADAADAEQQKKPKSRSSDSVLASPKINADDKKKSSRSMDPTHQSQAKAEQSASADQSLVRADQSVVSSSSSSSSNVTPIPTPARNNQSILSNSVLSLPPGAENTSGIDFPIDLSLSAAKLPDIGQPSSGPMKPPNQWRPLHTPPRFSSRCNSPLARQTFLDTDARLSSPRNIILRNRQLDFRVDQGAKGAGASNMAIENGDSAHRIFRTPAKVLERREPLTAPHPSSNLRHEQNINRPHSASGSSSSSLGSILASVKNAAIGLVRAGVSPTAVTVKNDTLPRTEHFELIRLEAAGGQGAIFLARLMLDRSSLIIIKVFYKRPSPHEFDAMRALSMCSYSSRMIGEAQITRNSLLPFQRQLHAMQVSLSSFNFEKGAVLGICYERLVGDLENVLLDNTVKINNAVKLLIALQIAYFLRAVHATGFIFRDIKPSNVLLSVKLTDITLEKACDYFMQNIPIIKVTDFGLITRASESRKSHSAGTVGYMPAEQMNSDQYGRSVDVHAYAITLTELFVESLVYDSSLPDREVEEEMKTLRVVDRVRRMLLCNKVYIPCSLRSVILDALAGKISSVEKFIEVLETCLKLLSFFHGAPAADMRLLRDAGQTPAPVRTLDNDFQSRCARK